MDAATGRPVVDHPPLELQARHCLQGAGRPLRLCSAHSARISAALRGSPSRSPTLAVAAVPLQLSVLDGRAYESLAAGGAGGAAPDAELERITLLRNQQVPHMPPRDLHLLPQAGWAAAAGFWVGASLHLPLICLPVPPPTCLPCRLQGKPLLAAKQGGADEQGRIQVPLVKGCALLPELSVTGGADGCVPTWRRLGELVAGQPAALPAHDLPCTAARPPLQAAARRCCRASARPSACWPGR